MSQSLFGLIAWIAQFHQPTQGAPAMRILAIDLGKSNSVACDFEVGGNEHTFKKIATRPEPLQDLLDRVRPDRVVIEISPLAGWVGDQVRAAGIELQVANTNGDAWQWRKVKRKTDRDDALKLAHLSSLNQLSEVYLPPRRIRQWRSLIHYRQTLVARRTATKNRIRAILDREALQLPTGKSGWTAKWVSALCELARSIGECGLDDLWRGQLSEELDHLERLEMSLKRATKALDQLAETDPQIRQLRTIPGVGPRLAETVVTAIDNPHRFASGKEVAAYAGLTPRQFQSGAMERHGRITGRGSKDLRKLLVEVSWLGLRHNPRMREVYERVRRDSRTRKKIAIVAVARRLLIWCWAMLRDEKDWECGKERSRSKKGQTLSKAA
jgi:transposase